MAKFKVLRRHDGDKEYFQGDERTAKPADVKHLVDLGILELVEDGDDVEEVDDEAARLEREKAGSAKADAEAKAEADKIAAAKRKADAAAAKAAPKASNKAEKALENKDAK